jgi:hypothetical protein
MRTTKQEYIQSCKTLVHNMLNRKHLLITYVRDRKGHPIGVVVAVKILGGHRLGYARCNTSLDQYNKYIGIRQAIKRALDNPSICSDNKVVNNELDRMEHRAASYFGKRNQKNMDAVTERM